MGNKTLIPILAVVLLAGTSSMPVHAIEPVYDQNGNLVLDMENEEYKDLSEEEPMESDKKHLNKSEGTEIILDEPVGFIDKTTIPDEGGEGNGETTEPVVPPETVEPPTTEPTDPPITEPEVPEEPEIEPGEMSPAASTYVADTTTLVQAVGNKVIKNVELTSKVKLPEESWKFLSDTLTFDNNKMDEATPGSYTFTITFEDDTESTYQLKIVGADTTEDYWKQNAIVFSKDERSSQYRDIQLIPNRKSITINSITISGVTVPKDKYIITQGIITISKQYLATLEESPRARITVNYNSTYVDFDLAIFDTIDESNSSEYVDC